MTKTVSPPTRPARVSVPIDAETLAVFERLAKASSQSTGKAIAEWLADTVEGAELMASTLERARAAPKVVTAELHAMMLGMVEQTKELQDKFRKYKGTLDEWPGDGKRSAAAGHSAGIPPACNTGGKFASTGGKFASTGGESAGGKRPKPKGEPS